MGIKITASTEYTFCLLAAVKDDNIDMDLVVIFDYVRTDSCANKDGSFLISPLILGAPAYAGIT